MISFLELPQYRNVLYQFEIIMTDIQFSCQPIGYTKNRRLFYQDKLKILGFIGVGLKWNVENVD
jgi:hypothetical protein